MAESIQNKDISRQSNDIQNRFVNVALEEKPIRTRVVLITLDGVRTEEVFIGSHPYRRHRSYRHSRKHLMPFIWNQLVRKNTIQFGNKYSKKKYNNCYIDNPSGRSLPAYANLLANRVQSNVITNKFKGKIIYPGILDNLSHKNYHKKEFAIFASWKPIQKIISQNSIRNFIVNTGRKNKSPKPPWKQARYDYYTYKAVMKFLNTNNNFKFLFVSFNDSDEWGHYGNYSRYLRSIRRQSYYIKRIYNKIINNKSNVYNTTFIITTDHGRGRGRYWRNHSAKLRGPKNIWAFVHRVANRFNVQKNLEYDTKKLMQVCTHANIGRLIQQTLENDFK